MSKLEAIKKKNRRLGILLGTLALVIIAGLALPDKSDAKASLPKGAIKIDYMPYLESMQPLAEKPYILLEFFRTNCGFCKASVPELNKLNANPNLSVVAYTHESTKDVKAFVEKYKVEYTISRATEEFLKQFTYQGVPTSFLVDTKSKKVIHKFVGKINSQRVLKGIE